MTTPRAAPGAVRVIVLAMERDTGSNAGTPRGSGSRRRGRVLNRRPVMKHEAESLRPGHGEARQAPLLEFCPSGLRSRA